MSRSLSRIKEIDEHIIITGGGSGGHTTTAMATIDELVRKDPTIKDRITYVGGSLTMEGESNKESIEEKVAKKKGVRFVKIRCGKLQRQFSFRTITLLWGVVGGIIDSVKFFRGKKVKMVFSTGGYVTVPVCLIAWLKKIPIVIHEQTTRVGLSNKITSIFAKRILVGFHAAGKYFPKKKTKFVGNTVREIFLDPWNKKYLTPEIFKKLTILKKRKEKSPVVLICGGGQGSHLINTTVRMALKSLISSYQLIIITGDNTINRDYEKLNNEIKKLPVNQQESIILTTFAGPEMGAYFDVADLFVGRSGALFAYEVGFTKTPAIFIPIPWVTHNEQYFNAKALEDLGLAEILPQGVLNSEIFVQRISKMIDKIKANTLKIKNHAIEKFFIADGAENIANELKRYL